MDPEFTFAAWRRLKWSVLSPTIFLARYHECTSDEYFMTHGRVQQLDVVLTDGLHTHEQSNKDVMNSLERLSANGYILMHDCNPPNAVAAISLSDLPNVTTFKTDEADVPWCGDVWRTIVRIRRERSELDAFVLDCDYGVGVVVRTPQPIAGRAARVDVRDVTYSELQS